MNKTIKNVLIFGIPTVIIIVIIVIVIKEIRGGKSKCPSGETMAFDGTCLQCDPQDPRCAVCVKPSDCQHGGTCYKDESTNGNGVCICTGGWKGVNCDKYCDDNGDCKNNAMCVDGLCHCKDGTSGDDCGKIADMKNCKAPDCNAITIIKLKCIAKGVPGPTALATIQILYYGTSNDGNNKTFEAGQILTLGGFPKTGGWSVFNGVLATVRNMVSDNVPNEKERCWYYCCGGGSRCDNPPGPFYPKNYPHNVLDQNTCNPPENTCAEAVCFAKDCPVYNVVEVQIPLAKASILGVGTQYTYYGQGWGTTAYIQFTDTVPTCYNNTTTGGGDDLLCRQCITGWGPGVDKMNKAFTIQQPPMGICGRRLNDYPIQITAKENVGDDDDSYNFLNICQTAYGNNSCNSGGGNTRADCWSEDHPTTRGTYPKCNVDNFWSYPGTNCQTGAWNTCGQCGSTDGQNEQDSFGNQSEGCGAIINTGSSAVDCSKNAPTPIDTSCCDHDCYPPSNLYADFLS